MGKTKVPCLGCILWWGIRPPVSERKLPRSGPFTHSPLGPCASSRGDKCLQGPSLYRQGTGSAGHPGPVTPQASGLSRGPRRQVAGHAPHRCPRPPPQILCRQKPIVEKGGVPYPLLCPAPSPELPRLLTPCLVLPKGHRSCSVCTDQTCSGTMWSEATGRCTCLSHPAGGFWL